MFVASQKWCLRIVLLVGLLALAGCQSCQDTKAPPPSQTAPQPAAPVADEPEPGDEAANDAVDDEVDEDALVLLAEGDPEDGAAPLSVKFMVESLLEDEMNGPQYKWDFGDGSPISTEASPTHVYEKPGSFTATIRVVDAAGQLGWDEVDIEVDEP
jgi:PKD repeat protein